MANTFRGGQREAAMAGRRAGAIGIVSGNADGVKRKAKLEKPWLRTLSHRQRERHVMRLLVSPGQKCAREPAQNT